MGIAQLFGIAVGRLLAGGDDLAVAEFMVERQVDDRPCRCRHAIGQFVVHPVAAIAQPGFGQQFRRIPALRPRDRQPAGRAYPGDGFQPGKAGGDQRAFIGFGQAGGDGAVHVGRMGDDFMPGGGDLAGEIGKTRGPGAVHRETGARADPGERFDQPWHAKPRAIIARGEMPVIGKRRLHVSRRAERRVRGRQREEFARNDNGDGNTLAARPGDRRPVGDVRPGVEAMVHAVPALRIFEIGRIETHAACSRYASAIAPAVVIHARPSAAICSSTRSKGPMRCGWPIR